MYYGGLPFIKSVKRGPQVHPHVLPTKLIILLDIGIWSILECYQADSFEDASASISLTIRTRKGGRYFTAY